jgi:radical SAM-linked protein
MNQRCRLRIRFRKEGDLRLLGHHDLARTWERALRRSALALNYSQGFRRRPRIHIAAPLGLGIEGRDEAMEIELGQAASPDTVRTALEGVLPPGLSIHRIESMPASAPKARAAAAVYELPIPPERQAELAALAAGLLARRDRHRAGAEEPPHAKLYDGLDAIEIAGGVLRMRLRFGARGCPRPRDVLAAMGWTDWEQPGTFLTRTAVVLQDDARPANARRNPPAAERPVQPAAAVAAKAAHHPPRNRDHEARNVDQRGPAGGMPDRHR